MRKLFNFLAILPSFIHASIPPCIYNESQIQYFNGALSMSQTVIECIKNIPDPMLIPTLYDGKLLERIEVYSTIQLNNLHEVCYFNDLYLRSNTNALPD
jgi:hypothetical protein